MPPTPTTHDETCSISCKKEEECEPDEPPPILPCFDPWSALIPRFNDDSGFGFRTPAVLDKSYERVFHGGTATLNAET